jgi:hypothetical protein
MPDNTDRLIRKLWDLASLNDLQAMPPVVSSDGEPTLAERDAAIVAPREPADLVSHRVARERDPIAYQTTRETLADFRADDQVSHIELLGGAECCPACAGYGPYRPIGADTIIPVPGCTNATGCICAVLPVPTHPLGMP